MPRWKHLIIAVGLLCSLTRLALPATIYSTLKAGNQWDVRSVASLIAGVSRTADHAAAWSFVAPSSVTADGVDLVLGKYDYTGFATGNSAVVEFTADNAGVPGTVLRTVLVEGGMPTVLTIVNRSGLMPGAGWQLVRFAFSPTLNLVSGSTYWVVLRMLAGDPTWTTWLQACQDQPLPGEGKLQIGATPWRAIGTNGQLFNGDDSCPLAFKITSP